MATQSQQSSVRRVLSILAVTIALLVGGTTSAWAQTPTQRATDLEFNVSMATFLAARATGEAPFDWTSDGCSTPAIQDLAKWNGTFTNPCLQHDFGYRNFGVGGVVQNATESMRTQIDNKFKQDMYDVCRPMSLGKRVECQFVASAYYNVVRNVGGAAFYS